MYINCFFIFSILGFIIETLLAFIFNYKFNSGFLYGPYSIVYGIGSIIIILIYKYLNKKINKNILIYILLFLFCSLLLTILEIIGGYSIELIFHKIFWKYNDNIILFKYSSLKMFIIFGISSITFIKFIYPLFLKVNKHIPKLITQFLLVIFIFDFILTFILKSYLLK